MQLYTYRYFFLHFSSQLFLSSFLSRSSLSACTYDASALGRPSSFFSFNIRCPFFLRFSLAVTKANYRRESPSDN